MTGNGPETPEGLIIACLGYGFGLVTAVSVGANISGGHVNPAVTLGVFLGGNITLFSGILYCISQVLGATAATYVLVFCTGEKASASALGDGVSPLSGVVFEMIMTFGLVYAVYATAVDPKKGNMATIAPISIALIVAANILAGGPFSGGSMNPAASFGAAMASGNWTNHWIYWAGPLLGGGLAGVIYEVLFIEQNRTILPSTDDY